MRSIDDYDYELTQRKERRKFKFTVNFKKIYMMNNILLEDNSDWDEKYPKNIFYSMIGGSWLGMAILFAFSNKFLLIVTLPFMFFYFLAIRSTYKSWKEYNYKKGEFCLVNLLGFALSIAVGFLLQILVLKFVL